MAGSAVLRVRDAWIAAAALTLGAAAIALVGTRRTAEPATEPTS